MRPYSPGGLLIALAAARKESIPPIPSNHRLRRGLPGYLILFAPHAFVPQCQLQASKSLSPPVFLLISTHSTATLGIPLTSPVLKLNSLGSSAGVKPRNFTTNLPSTYAPFTPSHSGQRLLPTYYRGCWHVVSRSLLSGYRHFLRPPSQNFTIRRPSSFTRRCWVRVPSIAQYSPLLPPVGVWTVSQFQCGRSPSQVGYPSSAWWAVTSPTT